MPLELSPIETRVLGALLEKERTTPEYYPLSLNGLVVACNQTTNRDPIVSYDDRTAEQGLDRLREKKLAMLVHTAGVYLKDLPPGVSIVDLGKKRTLFALPALVRYLRKNNPSVLIAHLSHANIVALLAKLNPLAVIPAAVLYGGMTVGANAMQRRVGIPSSITFILQSLIVRLFHHLCPAFKVPLSTRSTGTFFQKITRVDAQAKQRKRGPVRQGNPVSRPVIGDPEST